MEIRETQYYDVQGTFLWREDFLSLNIWAVGGGLIRNDARWDITGVVVADGIQYVNVDPA